MTVTKHEVLTVTTNGSDPQSIINAMRELPRDAAFTSTEGIETIGSWTGSEIAGRITFQFRREVTNE